MKKLLAIISALALMLVFTACGSSDTNEMSYIGEWEHIGTIENTDNVDDALTADIVGPGDQNGDVITINEDGTFEEIAHAVLDEETVEMEMHGTWKATDKGVILTYDYDEEGTADIEYLVTSDGSMLISPVSEDMKEAVGDIADAYRRK